MNGIAATLISIAAFQFGPSFGQGPSVDDFIVTEKAAYMVFPPQAVGSPQTTFMSWSPSGRYLLMGAMTPKITPALLSSVLQGNRPPEGGMSFSVFDRQTGRTVELGQVPKYAPSFHDRYRDYGLRWLKGADVAMDLVTEELAAGSDPNWPVERASILRIDAAQKRLHYIPVTQALQKGSFYQLYVSHAAPLGVIVEGWFDVDKLQTPERRSVFAVWTVDANGRFGQKTPAVEGGISQIVWSSDPNRTSLRTNRRFEGNLRQSWHILDLTSGKLEAAESPLSTYKPPAVEPDFDVVLAPNQTITGVVKRSHPAAWLKSAMPSEQSEYLLTPKAEYAELNSTLDAVAVLQDGVVSVRLLSAVPIDLYKQAKLAAEKAKALSDVKQIGLACLMYGADHDDVLPPASEFSTSLVNPYAKNLELFNGFTYVFAGGSVAKMENPVGTMLGYKPAAGGFAVVFADGHARWLPELPK